MKNSHNEQGPHFVFHSKESPQEDQNVYHHSEPSKSLSEERMVSAEEKKAIHGYELKVTPDESLSPKRSHEIIEQDEDEVPNEKVSKKKKSSKSRQFASDILKQLAVSAVILVVGVVAFNWSAYSKIVTNYFNELTGTNSPSPLNTLVEQPDYSAVEIPDIADNATIPTNSATASVSSLEIPSLNLEVAPSDNRIIIPRIDQNIPVVRISSESLIRRDWAALEKQMQEALQDGVVHYPGTSLPGQGGNVAITGHSSYFPWDPGRFKDVFALLHNVVIGDKIVIYWNQKKYIYEVTEIKTVLPSDIAVLKQTPEETLTLITCTPVGTNLKRLIVTAKPYVDPNAPIAR